MSLISSPPIRACLLTSLESRLCLLYGVSYKTYFTRSPTLVAICIRNAHVCAFLTALCKSNLWQILQFKGPEQFRVQTRGVTIPGLESESDFHHYSWLKIPIPAKIDFLMVLELIPKWIRFWFQFRFQKKTGILTPLVQTGLCKQTIWVH